jgi:hypothetical protein
VRPAASGFQNAPHRSGKLERRPRKPSVPTASVGDDARVPGNSISFLAKRPADWACRGHRTFHVTRPRLFSRTRPTAGFLRALRLYLVGRVTGLFSCRVCIEWRILDALLRFLFWRFSIADAHTTQLTLRLEPVVEFSASRGTAGLVNLVGSSSNLLFVRSASGHAVFSRDNLFPLLFSAAPDDARLTFPARLRSLLPEH